MTANLGKGIIIRYKIHLLSYLSFEYHETLKTI